MRGSSVVNIVVGLVVIAAGVTGVIVITGANNRRRQRLIIEYVGFDPNYYQKAGTDIGHQRAKVLADEVYNAIGIFNDNEEKVYGVLKSAKTAGNLSLISHYFQIRHGENMGGFISDYLDRKTETKTVLDILKTLKK